MTFFKKYQPSQSIIFSDGSGFRAFEIVDNDWGILATEDPRIIRELEACIREKRGGTEKITGEEFLELQSQKKSNLKPPWREEWQPRKLPPTVGASPQSPQAVAAVGEPPQVITPPPGSAQVFRPKTSKL